MIAGVGRLRPAWMAPHRGPKVTPGVDRFVHPRPARAILSHELGRGSTRATIVIPALRGWVGRTTVVDRPRGPGLAELEGQVVAFVAQAAL